MRSACALLLAFSVPSALYPQAGEKVDSQILQQLEAAQQAISAAPESETNRITLASIYLKVGQNQGAEKVLQSYLQSHPDALRSLRLLALAYLREENYTEAKETAEHALRFGQRDSATVQVLGMAELGLQATDSGEQLLREAVRLDPNSVEANFQLGLLYTNEHKNLTEAIRLLQRARTLQPSLAPTYAALGSAFLASGNAEQAVKILEKAVALNSKSAESYYVLAQAYRQLQQEDKSQAALSQFNALKKAESDGRARDMRSRADYEAGVNLLSNTDQLDKAYELLAKSVRELPTFDPGYYRMAQVSYLKGDYQSAVTSIREALRLNPLEPEYYFVLSRGLENSDLRAALDAINKAVSLRPGVADFENLLQDLKAKVAAKSPQHH